MYELSYTQKLLGMEYGICHNMSASNIGCVLSFNCKIVISTTRLQFPLFIMHMYVVDYVYM